MEIKLNTLNVNLPRPPFCSSATWQRWMNTLSLCSHWDDR
jgi:hypothetical protein